MAEWGTDGTGAWLLILAAFLAGLAASPAAGVLIFRFMPRLGPPPRTSVRIMTAVLTAVICAAFAARLGDTAALPAFLFLAILGTQLARIDISRHLLPNPLVLLLFSGGLLLLLVAALFDKQAGNVLNALLGAGILFAGYLILALISPGGIGMGDVKLAAPVGLYLGYLGWSQLLYGGLFGFVVNGMVTLVVISTKPRNTTKEVAHGPSMLGALAAVALLLR
ncbi:peptidase [Arthrobacter sp. ZBG10]|uniref:prepilin peptidase n=1 Tax=Arthrobacter sp. ZBG10 TaxID=1676590 RepID=UPI000681845B|nr:prepilin peptidase [Arthrobacter sp. ZBG10]KNH20045.1 peptidase [Arthrobacter sp. ZBG10]